MSIGPLQIIIILAIILLFFGPKRLPGLAKSLGESIRGFKKSLGGEDDSRDVTNTASQEDPTEQLNSSESQSAHSVNQKETEKNNS